MGKCYLAFDLGASSGRGIIGELVDGKLTLTEIHRFKNGPIEQNGSLHWDFDSIWSEIKTGVKKAVETGKDITSIAVDTWGVDYVLLKEDGSFARLPYHYRDSRTDNAQEEVFAEIPEDYVYSHTGIQYMQFNTMFQLYYHRKQHPEDLEGAKLMLIPDALTYMLCGKVACEYTEASTGQLLDAKKREWDFELIDKLELPRSLFPELAAPGSMALPLTEELQRELGCGPIPVCHVGSHDTASAVVSVPASEDLEWAYISCGTWALLGDELDEPILTEQARLAHYTNEGGVERKIRFLTNIMGTWLLQETRRVWQEAGKDISFAEMEDMAKASTPLRYLVKPNDLRFFSPGDMPARAAEYCELTGQGNIEDDATALRCIYDSLALCFRDKLEELEQLLGIKYGRLHMVGGGTKDKLLMQLTADALGIPVVAGPVEATATGNILVQAMANSEIADLAAARETVKASFELEHYAPNLADKSNWDAALAKLKGLAE